MTLFTKKSAEEPVPADVPRAPEDSHVHRPDELLDLAVLLSQQVDFQEILRLITAKGLALFHADALSILVLNPTTQHTIKTLLRDGEKGEDRAFHLLRVNVAGWVMKHREPFLSADLSTDARFVRGLFSEGAVCSAMCVPMQNEGQICGHILVTSRAAERPFARADLEFLVKCAAVWAGFLNNARRVQEYFSEQVPDDVLLLRYAALGMHGRSRRFRELLRSVEAASKCDVRVFLEGQSGSGKERVARAIHTLGHRGQRSFVAIDCGAIPATLVESELFGHVKGAFTGAQQARKGLLEEADGGTLFMDEIGNLPPDIQVKLLRVLQEGEVRAIGANQTRKVDVRIIAASSTPAGQLVREKTLREDLFYRLHVYPISVPTLNERGEDIPLLADHFLKAVALRQKKPIESIHPSLVLFMRHRKWQGNVRELENFVERMVTLAPEDKTVLDHVLLPGEYQGEYRSLMASRAVRSSPAPLRESLDEHERRIIHEALSEHDWNQSEAARALRISERAMRYKMKKLRIENPGGGRDQGL